MNIDPQELVQRSSSPDQTASIARIFAKCLEEAAGKIERGLLVALNGTLGSGKTFFVQHVLRELGVDADVVSPTFTICIPYVAPRIKLWHLDAYRVEHLEEVDELGLDEAVGAGITLLIEWGAKIATVAPPQDIEIRIEVQGPAEREFRFAPKSPPGASVVSELATLLKQLG